MSETTGISQGAIPPLAGESAQNPQPLAASQQLFATLFSAVCPGAGHLLLGQFPKGILLSGIFAGLLFCYWPLRLLHHYTGFVTLFATHVVLGIYAVCSCQWVRRSGNRISPWWFFLTLPVALVIISLAGLGAVRVSGFRAFNIPSTGMQPTILRGDSIFVDNRAYRSSSPQYRDVIVFRKNDTFLVKRIVAVSGDTIEGRNDQILLNGNLINESYIQHSESQSGSIEKDSEHKWLHSFGPVSVPSNEYFVMGDNRDVSVDSRSPTYGFIDKSAIIGRVLYVYKTSREGMKVR